MYVWMTGCDLLVNTWMLVLVRLLLDPVIPSSSSLSPVVGLFMGSALKHKCLIAHVYIYVPMDGKAPDKSTLVKSLETVKLSFVSAPVFLLTVYHVPST